MSVVDGTIRYVCTWEKKIRTVSFEAKCDEPTDIHLSR